MRYYYIDPSSFPLFIGICHYGWAFLLCVKEVPDLIAWKEKFKTPGSRIESSSGDVISPEEMEIIITMRNGSPDVLCDALRRWVDLTEGPHGLVRRAVGRTVSNSECIANEDCWDLCLTNW